MLDTPYKYNEVPSFFWFDPFLEARAEIKKLFVRFLVQMSTRKFAFEIIWALVTY
jgi:hypothetical protein